MTAHPTSLPDGLRRSILVDLRPVQPLRRPWVRLLALIPLAALVLLGQVLAMGLRRDASALGFGLLWGVSALQAVVGLVLIGAALREAVPGRTLGWTSAALLGLALVWTVGVTHVTWSASAIVVPRGRELYFWIVCFRDTVMLGLPVLVLALLLAARAFPLRPALVGGLAGMGAGLLSDAGWRTFCHVSDPRHVLLAHVVAVACLAILGALGGRLWMRGSEPSARASRTHRR